MTSLITQAALNPLVLAMARLGLGRILALPAQLLIHFIFQIHNEIRCLYFWNDTVDTPQARQPGFMDKSLKAIRTELGALLGSDGEREEVWPALSTLF
jgi:hypothetical protein